MTSRPVNKYEQVILTLNIRILTALDTWGHLGLEYSIGWRFCGRSLLDKTLTLFGRGQ